ncbi:MAG: CBS and ACT domain-containing protein [Deltaproteobacteria bacterium]|nr:CBS and ACT domain-containing protein [Deltaproteobacteria bacterium]
MKIKSLMITSPVTVSENASIQRAIELMKEKGFRHLPVVSKGKKLKGFVTLSGLKQGLIPAMIGDLTLSDLMILDPITVAPDDDLETAARLIYEHKISGMPVVKNDKVVGIITESDILRAFIDMMGILTGGSRLDVAVGDQPEAFNQVVEIIRNQDGEIINIGMTAQQSSRRVYTFRLSTMKTAAIEKALTKAGFQILKDKD